MVLGAPQSAQVERWLRGCFAVKKGRYKGIQAAPIYHPNDMDSGPYTTNKVEASRRRSRALRQKATAIRAETRKLINEAVANLKHSNNIDSAEKARKAA